jgi:hypothetical protein
MNNTLSRKERIKALTSISNLQPFIRILVESDKEGIVYFDVEDKAENIIYSTSLEEAANEEKERFVNNLLDDARRRREYDDQLEWVQENVGEICYSTDGLVAAYKTGICPETEECYETYIVSSFSKFYHNHDEIEFTRDFDIDWCKRTPNNLYSINKQI